MAHAVHNRWAMQRSPLPIALCALALVAPACDFERSDEDDAMQMEENDDDATPPEGSGESDGQEVSEEDGEMLAEVASDAGDAVSGESALVATVSVAAAQVAADAESDDAIAEAAAASSSLIAMCASGGTVRASVAGNAVTYSFLNCSSHCGMHRATGDVVVSYSGLPDGVSVNLDADDFRIDGTRTDLAVQADYRLTGALASMSIETDATVTGWFGWEITRAGSYDATFDAEALCITHDGDWSTSFSGWTYNTKLVDYRRCALSCPDAGSRIEFEAPTWTFAAEFESDTHLTWDFSTGLRGEIELPVCG